MEPTRALVVTVIVAVCAVALAVLIWLVRLPRIEGPRPIRFPACQEEDDPLACHELEERFHDGCLGCHSTLSFQRVAPDLVGLLGRQRTFASGESLVADEAYIRRSIADHTDKAEYVPGYAVLPNELEDASRGLTDRDIDKLTTRVVQLQPHSILAGVEITKEWSAEDSRVEDIDDLLEDARESLRDCYQGALAADPDAHGAFEVEFRERDRPHLGGEIVRTDVTNPIVVNCVKSVLEYHDGVPHFPPRDGLVARYRIEMSTAPVKGRQAPN